jgi:hypothetical protein
MARDGHGSVRDVICLGMDEEELEDKLPCELAGHCKIAMGSISTCSPSWRTFVRRSMVTQWIEDGYRLL